MFYGDRTYLDGRSLFHSIVGAITRFELGYRAAMEAALGADYLMLLWRSRVSYVK